MALEHKQVSTRVAAAHEYKRKATSSDVADTDEDEDLKRYIIEIEAAKKSIENSPDEFKEVYPTVALDVDGVLSVVGKGIVIGQGSGFPICIPNAALSKLVFTILAREGRRIIAASMRVRYSPEHIHYHNMETAFDRVYGEDRGFLLSREAKTIHEKHQDFAYAIAPGEDRSKNKNDVLETIKFCTGGSPVMLVDDTELVVEAADNGGFQTLYVQRRKGDSHNERDYLFLAELMCREFPHTTAGELLTIIRKQPAVKPEEMVAQGQLERIIHVYIRDQDRKLHEILSQLASDIVADGDKLQVYKQLFSYLHRIPKAKRGPIVADIHKFIKMQLMAWLNNVKICYGLSQQPWGLLKQEHYDLALATCRHGAQLVHFCKLAESYGFGGKVCSAVLIIRHHSEFLFKLAARLFDQCRMHLTALIREYKSSAIAEKVAKVANMEVVLDAANKKPVLEHFQRYISAEPPEDLSPLLLKAYMECPLLKTADGKPVSLKDYLNGAIGAKKSVHFAAFAPPTADAALSVAVAARPAAAPAAPPGVS